MSFFFSTRRYLSPCRCSTGKHPVTVCSASVPQQYSGDLLLAPGGSPSGSNLQPEHRSSTVHAQGASVLRHQDKPDEPGPQCNRTKKTGSGSSRNYTGPSGDHSQ